MKKLLLLTLAVAAFGLMAGGCSDDNNDNNVVGTTPPDSTATSTWDAAGGFWRTTVDGSDYDSYMYFSFTTQDTVTSGVPKPAADVWDIAFKREVIKLNGGTSTGNSGDAVAADLGQVSFNAVTIADTAGATWSADAVDYFISEWYTYNPITHALAANQYVYSMLDAGGQNYVKFRVDSMVGAGMPPDMGTVWISYYYQPTAGSTALDGALETASITVGAGTGYFDFSAGAQVTPSTPKASAGWDIAFSSYNCMQNSGPNGTGQCAAFPAFTELTDSTDIEGFTQQPAGAPLFPDIPSSALTEWYNYNGTTHTLTSQSHVYLIKTADVVYKLRIDSYYKSVGGVPASGHYTFVWKQL